MWWSVRLLMHKISTVLNPLKLIGSMKNRWVVRHVPTPYVLFEQSVQCQGVPNVYNRRLDRNTRP